jgi:RHS repeat-associated protein
VKVVDRSRGLAALALAFALAMPAHAATSVTTTTSYDYVVATGQLRKVMVEPGDSRLCVVTAYTIDPDTGLPKTSTTRNCNGSAGTAPGAMTEASAPAASDLATIVARASSVTYSADKRFIETTTNALSQSESKSYDARFGAVATVSGPDQLTTTWTYDALGRKKLEKRPDGTGTQWTYVFCSNLSMGGTAVPVPGGAASATCASVRADELTQDHAGDLIVPSYYAQATPLLTDGATSAGAYLRTYYDTLNRPIRTETVGYDGSGTGRLALQDTRYDRNGRVAAVSQPYYSGDTIVWTVHHYDVLGRLTSSSQPTAAGTATTTFSYAGGTTTVTDPMGYATSQTLNVAGQVATVKDAKGGALQRRYDPLGNLVQSTDAAGNVISITYDKRSRKTALYDPDLGVWQYAYNAAGQLVNQTDAKQQSATFSYDLVGRLTRRAEPDLISTWSYDTNPDGTSCGKSVGQLCQASADNGYLRQHGYDTAGRPASVTTTANNTTYAASVAYSATTGRVDTRTYPTGVKLKYGYTSMGFLRQVIDTRNNKALWTATALDARGSLLQYSYGNGVTTNQSYDSDGRIATIQAGTSNAVQNLSYLYDLDRNVKSRTDLASSVTAAYDYDELNRLKSETRSSVTLPANLVMSWAYDVLGNITHRVDEEGIDNVYNYNASGRGSKRPHAVGSVSGYVNGTPVPEYEYDANGNLTTGAGRSISWTSYNMVSSISQRSSKLAYLYDAEHQRVKETYTVNGTVQRTTVYLNPADGAGLYYEEDITPTGTRKKHYVSAGGQTVAVIVCTASPCTTVANTSTQYWHNDSLGSVSVVTSEAGAVVERLAYEPFGKRRQASGVGDPNGNLAPATDRGFTGHEQLDEVGLINMNGRLYDPALGRFVSADPGLPYPNSTQSYNRYSYMQNNPLGGTDPSGMVDSANNGCNSSASEWGDWCEGWSGGQNDPHNGSPDGSDGSTNGSSTLPGDNSNFGTGAPGDPVSAAFPGWTWLGSSQSGMSDNYAGPTTVEGDNEITHLGTVGHREKPSYLAQAASIGLDVLPIVGTGKAFIQLVTGRDLVTGQPSNAWMDGAGLFLGLIPGGRMLLESEKAVQLGMDIAKACCCFAPGTPVLTEAGPMPIEQVQIGTKVYSRDEATGQVALKPVLAVILNEGRPLYALTLVDDKGHAARTEVTDNHPYWVIGRGWVESLKLERGMKLATFNGKPATVVNISDLNRRALTYNLTVADFHTYFAGEGWALVHNTCACGLVATGAAAAEREATGFLGRAGNELKNAPYQKVRNKATQINGRDFSGHALDQMQNRGVMPSVVENALNTGTQFPTRAGTNGFYDAVNNVRVIVNSETGLVVTVIRGAP